MTGAILWICAVALSPALQYLDHLIIKRESVISALTSFIFKKWPKTCVSAHKIYKEIAASFKYTVLSRRVRGQRELPGRKGNRDVSCAYTGRVAVDQPGCPHSPLSCLLTKHSRPPLGSWNVVSGLGVQTHTFSSSRLHNWQALRWKSSQIWSYVNLASR